MPCTFLTIFSGRKIEKLGRYRKQIIWQLFLYIYLFLFIFFLDVGAQWEPETTAVSTQSKTNDTKGSATCESKQLLIQTDNTAKDQTQIGMLIRNDSRTNIE